MEIAELQHFSGEAVRKGSIVLIRPSRWEITRRDGTMFAPALPDGLPTDWLFYIPSVLSKGNALLDISMAEVQRTASIQTSLNHSLIAEAVQNAMLSWVRKRFGTISIGYAQQQQEERFSLLLKGSATLCYSLRFSLKNEGNART